MNRNLKTVPNFRMREIVLKKQFDRDRQSVYPSRCELRTEPPAVGPERAAAEKRGSEVLAQSPNDFLNPAADDGGGVFVLPGRQRR